MDLVKKSIDFVMDILETIVFIGSLFIVVYLFVFQPHQVKGASMDDTFHDGDYILTSKISYRFDQPKRGDVVVFKSPKNDEVDFIKRIVALPGDHIRISDGIVYVNDVPMEELYAKHPTTPAFEGFIKENDEVTVPDGYMFVMGDNRPRSSDSREFGFIPFSFLVGKVFFQYFPPQKIGPIKNPYQTSLLPSSYYVYHLA